MPLLPFAFLLRSPCFLLLLVDFCSASGLHGMWDCQGLGRKGLHRLQRAAHTSRAAQGFSWRVGLPCCPCSCMLSQHAMAAPLRKRPAYGRGISFNRNRGGTVCNVIQSIHQANEPHAQPSCPRHLKSSGLWCSWASGYPIQICLPQVSSRSSTIRHIWVYSTFLRKQELPLRQRWLSMEAQGSRQKCEIGEGSAKG